MVVYLILMSVFKAYLNSKYSLQPPIAATRAPLLLIISFTHKDSPQMLVTLCWDALQLVLAKAVLIRRWATYCCTTLAFDASSLPTYGALPCSSHPFDWHLGLQMAMLLP